MSTHVLRYAARTHQGMVRQNNQDSVFAGDRLLIVADGMGGHAAGDKASRLAVAAFRPLNDRKPTKDLLGPLDEATRESNLAIARMVAEEPSLEGMGTTVTALLFDGNRLGIAHVGDSRAYLWRDGVLSQITHDDTFVQSLIDEGRITEDEAAHHPQRSLLLRAVNGTDTDPTLQQRVLQVGDRYLLCSDGLSGVVSPEAIADTLASFDVEPAADRLIELALAGGGPDNITVIVADVLETGVQPGLPLVEEIDPDADLEATGPILPVHVTQRMPRIPLPAEDTAADEDNLPTTPITLAAPAQVGPAEDGAEIDEDDLVLTAPERERSWWRRGIFPAAIVLLAAAVVTGSAVWVRSQYYVGDDNGTVAIFRGVDGSLLGWELGSAIEDSCAGQAPDCVPLRSSDLIAGARSQVDAGIPAGGREEARQVLARLAQELLPACPEIAATTAPVTPSELTTMVTTEVTQATTSTAAPTTSSSVPNSPATNSPATNSPATTASVAVPPAPITRSAARPTGVPRTSTAPATTGSANLAAPDPAEMPLVGTVMALAAAAPTGSGTAGAAATDTSPTVVVTEQVRTLVLTLTQTISSTVPPTSSAPMIPGETCREVG